MNIAFARKDLRDNAAKYRELIEDLYRLKIQPAVYGDTRLGMSYIANSTDIAGAKYGWLVRFVDIDHFRWFNSDERRAATPEERAQIRVPKNMRANAREFPFIFEPKTHHLVFGAKYEGPPLSVKQVKALFEKLVSTASIRKEYGLISISIIQEPGRIKALLDNPTLRRLSIRVLRPNDTVGALTRRVIRDLDRMAVSESILTLKADESMQIRPSQDVRDLAEVAAENGEVTGVVLVQNRVKEVSSENYPLSRTVTYSERDTSSFKAFIRVALDLLESSLRREGNRKK